MFYLQTQHGLQNQYGENSLLVVVYDKGSFLTSQQIVQLSKSNNEILTLEQEVVDKSNTQKISKCKTYNKWTEDDCLNECLANSFVQEFGCLHSRLSRLKLQNETLRNGTKICLYEDLAGMLLCPAQFVLWFYYFLVTFW